MPVTITTDGLATVGCGGPFISSGGNVYVFLPDDDRFDLRALKAADPVTAFSAVGIDVVIGSGGDVIQSIAAYQVNDLVHVVTKNSNGTSVIDIRYHVFNCATDSWATSNEMVVTNLEHAEATNGFAAPIDVTVRSDGDVILIYNGSQEDVAATMYDRVFYARREAAVWTTAVPLGTAGVAAHWYAGGSILGAGDRTHFFFTDVTNQDLYQRTLTSANALESGPAAFDTTIEADYRAPVQRGAYVTAQGIVSFPYYDQFQVLNRAVFTSVDAPTISVTAVITSPTAVLTEPIRHVISHCVDGNDLWNVFIATDKDIYTNYNSAGTGFTQPFVENANISASAVYANIYTRGADRVIAFVYHDSGNPVYDERILSTSSSGALIPKLGSRTLMKVGR